MLVHTRAVKRHRLSNLADHDQLVSCNKRSKLSSKSITDELNQEIFTHNPLYLALDFVYHPAETINIDIKLTESQRWFIDTHYRCIASGSWGNIFQLYTANFNDKDYNDYVAKVIRYQEYGLRTYHTLENFKKTVRQEIEIQQKAYKIGVALPILSAWFSDELNKPLPQGIEALPLTKATIVMKRADLTLNDLIAKKYKDCCFINNIKKQLHDLLDKLHCIGISHNDLSFNNIMYIERERKLVLIDFGLASYSEYPAQDVVFSEGFDAKIDEIVLINQIIEKYDKEKEKCIS